MTALRVLLEHLPKFTKRGWTPVGAPDIVGGFREIVLVTHTAAHPRLPCVSCDEDIQAYEYQLRNKLCIDCAGGTL